VVAVRFLGVGGALGPVHREPGNAESGYVREVVDGVVEQGDGVSEQAADDLRSDQTQRGGHGPTEDRRAQGGVRVTVVMTMTVAETL
jgi:hypothetical protein